MNYFSDVQVTTNPGGKGYRDINILVDEKQTGSLNFGVGFSSIDSIVGYLTLEQTNFDIANPWSFTGAGQHFQASIRAGSERQDYSVSLVEPWFLGRKLALGGELYYTDSTYYSDVWDQSNAGGAVFLRWPLGEKGYLKALYRLERVDVSDDDYIIPPTSLFASQLGKTTRSGVTLSYVYDSRDSNITPRKGSKIDVSLNLNGTIFGGDVDTYEVRAYGAHHWNLWWDTILTVNGELAVVDATSGEVPVYEMLALGGARNLRGYEYREVGPRDYLPPLGTGEVYGGQTSACMTLELTVPIINNIRGAVFWDMGFVNVDAWDLSPDDLFTDAGIGLRLNLPMGPLAIDYALPVNSPDSLSDKGGQFQFYLNYQF
jgi:outer membrane protein insertion porin family